MQKTINFPVGYKKYLDDVHMNFQVNRWISLGYIKAETIKNASKEIKDFATWKNTMVEYARQASEQGDLKEAAFLYRAAEFFTHPDDPDKQSLYGLFRDYIDKAYCDHNIERLSTPYQDAALPVIKFCGDGNKGTVLIHGGYDSFVEEFFSCALYIQSAGYDVILFEGPGQGAALRESKLALTHEWEKPVGAVLDHLDLSGVTLVGISLGGYLAARAAAFETRISRVVLFGPIYDWMQKEGYISYLMAKIMMQNNFAARINARSEQRMREDFQANWSINHGMYITGTDSPFGFFKEMAKLSAKNLHSGKILQDVLMLSGEEDHLVGVKAFQKQKKALKNARSVTGRIFTAKEHAQNHCQVGNVKLALDYILDWMEEIRS